LLKKQDIAPLQCKEGPGGTRWQYHLVEWHLVGEYHLGGHGQEEQNRQPQRQLRGPNVRLRDSLLKANRYRLRPDAYSARPKVGAIKPHVIATNAKQSPLSPHSAIRNHVTLDLDPGPQSARPARTLPHNSAHSRQGVLRTPKLVWCPEWRSVKVILATPNAIFGSETKILYMAVRLTDRHSMVSPELKAESRSFLPRRTRRNRRSTGNPELTTALQPQMNADGRR